MGTRVFPYCWVFLMSCLFQSLLAKDPRNTKRTSITSLANLSGLLNPLFIRIAPRLFAIFRPFASFVRTLHQGVLIFLSDSPQANLQISAYFCPALYQGSVGIGGLAGQFRTSIDGFFSCLAASSAFFATFLHVGGGDHRFLYHLHAVRAHLPCDVFQFVGHARYVCILLTIVLAYPNLQIDVSFPYIS